jgi:hypothetical protein
MTTTRKELFRLLEEASECYPHWRLGQLVANVAMWAKQPTEPHDTGVWDIEDTEMVAALKQHLGRRESQGQFEHHR